ncbi:class I SAM-dependent methyltransferase, partial [Pseudohaliea rubra]|uniref:class I SAM-dependent methyltransferase n=1 Tax=Pseudohaliea rubra TaxID=475795 RepID=UPI000691D4FB
MTTIPRLAVALGDGGDPALARQLAETLSLPLLAVPGDGFDGKQGLDLLLLVDAAGPALRPLGPGASGPVRCRFDDGSLRHRRRNGHNEAIGRALAVGRAPGMRIIDGTGGFARDAFVLADLGAEVTVCERQPVLAALLGEALASAAASGDPWLREVAGRLQLVPADVRTLAPGVLAGADALYLDPMFPAARKRAASGKAMTVLQHLLDDDEATAAALVTWALAQPVRRVVVKRPRRAPPLGG